MCCLSWCQLTLEKIELFQRRDMSWQGLWFLSGRQLGQYADQEFLKSLFQNKTLDLSLKYHWSKCMTGRVSSKNKEKRPKGKIVLKKRPNRKQKLYKETLNSVAGSRTRFTYTCKQLLDHCTTVRRIIWKINFVISKQFFPAIDAVWSCWSCIYHEFKYTFEGNKLKLVFHSYFALFRVQRADSM